MRDGASAGFSLPPKCERRQSMALPRTHSRTRSKKKTAGFKPAYTFLNFFVFYEIRPFPPLILFVCPCMRGGASAGFSLSLKCERRQSTALPRTHSRTRSKQKKNRQNLFFFVCQGISKKIPYSFYQQKRTHSLKSYTVYHIILVGLY